MCAIGQTPNRTLLLSSTASLHIFYAPARRPIFVKIPKEDLEPGHEECMGQLQFILCVTRDAAWNWSHEYTTFLLSHGFQVGRASPCNSTHQARRIHLIVHGDDFTVVTSEKEIAWFGEAMRKRFELKMEVLYKERKFEFSTASSCGQEQDSGPATRSEIISELDLETCTPV